MRWRPGAFAVAEIKGTRLWPQSHRVYPILGISLEKKAVFFTGHDPIHWSDPRGGPQNLMGGVASAQGGFPNTTTRVEPTRPDLT